MPLILSLMISAALQSAPAPAPDWRPLGSVRGFDVSWDAAGVVRGETVAVRMRFAMRETPATGYAYSISRIEFRCAAAEVRTVETVNYRADGSPGEVDSVPVPWDPITPSSLFGTIYQSVC